jgi:predicted negative regulator of RcsB-dependent stress response
LASDQERYQKTIVEAQKTIDEYGSSKAALIAKYYLALSQDGSGDEASALSNLQEVIDGGDDAIKGVAQFALAGIHKRHGRTQEAIAVLTELDEAGAYARSAVNFELASVHEAAGQPELARDFYSKVIMEYADSPFRPGAETALRRMGFPVPTPAAAAAANP